MSPGQEWVWDYPRPPRLERSKHLVTVVFAGIEIVARAPAWRILETSHPPVYYIAEQDVAMEYLHPNGRRSFCEFKGVAGYYDLIAGERRSPEAAWSYAKPSAAYAAIAGHLSFYAGRVDECYVGDLRVTPQAGEFYGGWITGDVVGPFKGGAGTAGW